MEQTHLLIRLIYCRSSPLFLIYLRASYHDILFHRFIYPTLYIQTFYLSYNLSIIFYLSQLLHPYYQNSSRHFNHSSTSDAHKITNLFTQPKTKANQTQSRRQVLSNQIPQERENVAQGRNCIATNLYVHRYTAYGGNIRGVNGIS